MNGFSKRSKKLEASAKWLDQELLQKTLLIAFFGAMCLFFSTLENLIPKPVPFFRLGLANLPILLAFPLFKGRDIVMLTILKVLGQALINGTLASYVFLFSLAGSVASVLVMYLAWKACGKYISAIGVSLLGALASNIVQIVLSILYIFGTGAWLMAPLFMALGMGTGLMVGIIALLIADQSKWYEDLLNRGGRTLPVEQNPVEENPSQIKRDSKHRKNRWRAPSSWDILGRLISPAILFWTGLAILPAFLFQNSLVVRVAQVGLFIGLAIMAGKRVSFLYFGGMLISIALFNLLVPTGKVFFFVAGFPITELALISGLHKGLGIVGLVMISLATVRPQLVLPGSIGGLLGYMFRYYEEILSQRSHFDSRHPIASIDRILFRLGTTAATSQISRSSYGMTFAGWFLVGILVISQWSLLLVRK